MLLFISVIIFIVLQIFFSANAHKFNLIDKPGARKKHIGSIPTVGGISIILSLLFYYLLSDLNNSLQIIILTSLIVFISGLLDDIFKLSVLSRVILQLIACIILISYGFKIVSLGYYEILGTLNLELLSVPFSIIAIILLTNSINWIDGIDGLASTTYLQSFSAINMILIFNGNITEFDTIYNLLFINLLIFTLINMNRLPLYKSFLGDSGSTLIGYLLASYLIYVSNQLIVHPILIAWTVAFPIFNIISVMIIRISKLKNPFSPDRLHMHHYLQDVGFSDERVVIMLFCFACTLSFIGSFLFYSFGSLISLIFFIIIFILYIILNFIYANKN
tara:strand:+ start:2146 stop:3144 length:999 start_codon:yes stop_codon:yes gene_type:complete